MQEMTWDEFWALPERWRKTEVIGAVQRFYRLVFLPCFGWQEVNIVERDGLGNELDVCGEPVEGA